MARQKVVPNTSFHCKPYGDFVWYTMWMVTCAICMCVICWFFPIIFGFIPQSKWYSEICMCSASTFPTKYSILQSTGIFVQQKNRIQGKTTECLYSMNLNFKCFRARITIKSTSFYLSKISVEMFDFITYLLENVVKRQVYILFMHMLILLFSVTQMNIKELSFQNVIWKPSKTTKMGPESPFGWVGNFNGLPWKWPI